MSEDTRMSGNTGPREIVTMADLIDAARSTEDVDGLMADLRVWLDMALDLNLQTSLDTVGIDFKPKFIWKDDGERGMSGIRLDFSGKGSA